MLPVVAHSVLARVCALYVLSSNLFILKRSQRVSQVFSGIISKIFLLAVVGSRFYTIRYENVDRVCVCTIIISQ